MKKIIFVFGLLFERIFFASSADISKSELFDQKEKELQQIREKRLNLQVQLARIQTKNPNPFSFTRQIVNIKNILDSNEKLDLVTLLEYEKIINAFIDCVINET